MVAFAFPLKTSRKHHLNLLVLVRNVPASAVGGEHRLLLLHMRSQLIVEAEAAANSPVIPPQGGRKSFSQR